MNLWLYQIISFLFAPEKKHCISATILTDDVWTINKTLAKWSLLVERSPKDGENPNPCREISLAPKDLAFVLRYCTQRSLNLSNENVMSSWETVWCGNKYTDMKLNCLTLDVDTCQLSSFSVLRPWRQNSPVSTAPVKTLALTPQNSFPVFLPIPAHPTGVDCLQLQAYYLSAEGKLVQHIFPSLLLK